MQMTKLFGLLKCSKEYEELYESLGELDTWVTQNAVSTDTKVVHVEKQNLNSSFLF